MTGLLSYEELLALVARGVIQGVESLAQVNAASVDITLGRKLLVEKTMFEDTHYQMGPVIDLRAREALPTVEYDMVDQGDFILIPGQFILAQSREVFNLPNDISAEYKLKSSMARIGMNHALAGWCDAGWNGSVLTLELMNVTQRHPIRLRYGDRIGQMIFFHHRPVPREQSYAARGAYNGDLTAKSAKPRSEAYVKTCALCYPDNCKCGEDVVLRCQPAEGLIVVGEVSVETNFYTPPTYKEAEHGPLCPCEACVLNKGESTR